MKQGLALVLVVGGSVSTLGCEDPEAVASPTSYTCDSDTSWSWRSAPPMSVARSIAAAVALNDKVYVIGGATADGFTDRVERFDIATGEWTDVASLPMPSGGIAAAAIGERIYIAGGYDVDHDLLALAYSYDPVGDSWTAVPSMSIARANAAGTSWGGLFAVVGGRTVSNGSATADTVELYDPAEHSWTFLDAALSTPREATVVVGLDDELIVAGGANDDEATLYGLPTTERYDGHLAAWLDAPDLANARVGAAGGLIDGCMIVAGGWAWLGHTSSTEILVGHADQWSALPDMPTPRANPAAAVVAGELVIAGGWQLSGISLLDIATVEILAPAS